MPVTAGVHDAALAVGELHARASTRENDCAHTQKKLAPCIMEFGQSLLANTLLEPTQVYIGLA